MSDLQGFVKEINKKNYYLSNLSSVPRTSAQTMLETYVIIINKSNEHLNYAFEL